MGGEVTRQGADVAIKKKKKRGVEVRRRGDAVGNWR